MLKKIRTLARRYGFTASETNVALFLVAATAIGGLLQALRGDAPADGGSLDAAYAAHDSAFAALSRRTEMGVLSAADSAEPSTARGVSAAEIAKPPIAKGGIVDINSAGALRLTALPGVGPSTAKKIIEYRQLVGRFSKIEDIMNVKSIGPKKFEKMRDLISVGPENRAGQR